MVQVLFNRSIYGLSAILSYFQIGDDYARYVLWKRNQKMIVTFCFIELSPISAKE